MSSPATSYSRDRTEDRDTASDNSPICGLRAVTEA